MSDMVLRVLPVGPLQTNAYLLTCSGEAMLVDPGDEPETLLDAISDSGCRLSSLLCTHGHFDHVSAAAAIQQQWDVPLLCHEFDAEVIQRMPTVQSAYGFPPSAIPRLERVLQDGSNLNFADHELQVVHVPGHSPGHIMLILGSDVLVGDCVFQGSIGRTDLPGGNFSILEQSIQLKIYSLPDNSVLHPGHGPATTVEAEKRANPFVRPLPDLAN
ncbi:MAG: MBL fold metallo-hydrolase [bacterium]